MRHMPSFFPLCGAGTAANAANKISECLVEDVKVKADYVIRYRKKVEKFRKHVVEELLPLRNDVQLRVDAAIRGGEVVNEVVTVWIEKVKRLEKFLITTMEEDMNLTNKCIAGCCPNCVSRYKIGRDAAKKLKESEQLEREGKITTVSQPPPPPGVEDKPVGDFMNFSSTKVAMERVMSALKDDDKPLIGIYGMGGVGKTTLMDEIGRRLKNDKEFDIVVKAIVSHNRNPNQVRRDIADELGLRILGDGEQATRTLSKRLKELKKVVIMVDDIWDRLDLKQLGIPYGNEHKGCKILLTSRTASVCNMMETDESVLVDVLSESDSWDLFRDKAGDVVESAEIEPIARKVAKECGGLPLAIAVVGRALRGYEYDKEAWEDALDQLKQSSAVNLEGVEQQLYKSLDLSYQRLSSPELKLVFLHCCLFREDHNISEDELARLVMGEGLLKGINTMKEMRSRVHYLLHSLKTSCLLIGGEKEGCVKMHDVVRDVAVYIASREEDRFLVKAGLGLREWPDNDDLEQCKRISLMNNDLQELPSEPRCSKLLTLLLNLNPSLNNVPNNFFAKMATITVLDMSETNIASLPSSLTRLENLGMLHLDLCKKLRDINVIGQLKRLRILSLQSYMAEQLPEQLGSLRGLKLLDVSHSKILKIPSHVIQQLSRLEELYMLGCKVDWSVLVEIGSLKYLENLQVYVEDVQCFSQDMSPSNFDAWKNLSKFVIYTQRDWISLYSGLFKTCLYLNRAKSLANWAKILLIKSDDLTLQECEWGIKYLAEVDHFKELKKLCLTRCHNIVYLFDVNNARTQSGEVFCNIEVLQLGDLEKLSGICSPDTQIPDLSFRKLRMLTITNCKNFGAAIFSSGLMQRVNNNLQDLTVQICGKTEAIFDLEGLEGGCTVLPKLRVLKVTALPNLRGVWSGVVSCGSLTSIEIIEACGCDNLTSIFSSCHLDSDLVNPLPSTTMKNLRKLCIFKCAALKHVFLPSLAKELQNLEKLELKNNVEMIEIIAFEEGIELDKSVFPRLKEIILVNLENLEYFYQMERSETICFDWPSLKCIKLEGCNNLRRLPFGHRSAPNLEKATIDDDGELFKNLEESIKSRFRVM